MSKYGVLKGNFTVEEFSLIVVRTNLVPLPFRRMLPSVMPLIHIDSEIVRPCCFISTLTRFLCIHFGFKVGAELTSNGDHIPCVRTSLHDLETICGSMLSQKTSIGALCLL